MIRGDVTYFKDDFAGSHEFQTGVFIAPRSTYDQETELRERRLRPRGAARSRSEQSGRRALSRSIVATSRRSISSRVPRRIRTSASTCRIRGGRITRLTINGGVRFDYVKRQDDLFNIVREDAWHIGPRIGFSYMLTERRQEHRSRQLRARSRADDGPRRGDDLRRRRAPPSSATRSTSTATASSRPSASPPHAARASRPTSSIRTCISRTSTNSSSASASSSPGQWSTDVAFMKRQLPGNVRAARDQRLLAERTEPAVRRVRPRRSEPRSRVPADQQHLEHARVEGDRGRPSPRTCRTTSRC